jgi:hypothetical protein
MTKAMTRKKWQLGAIALLVLGLLLLFTILTSPQQQRLNDGSTFSRQPSGYGAWYAFMQAQGVKIQRWQKPVEALTTNQQTGMTLLQVYPQPIANFALEPRERAWLALGNKLVVLGVVQPVTEAEFLTTHPSNAGLVKIQSSRRRVPNPLMDRVREVIPEAPSADQPQDQPQDQILGDRYGSIIWQETIDRGQLIFATTPHLAANAYQKAPGNFKLLAQLVDPTHQIYVDEYLHGYRDQEEIAKSGVRDWISYLGQTPVFVVCLQVGLIFLVFLVAYNQRFGRVIPLTTPKVNNSQAYMQAIAAVLEKADCADFLVETIGKAEQIKLQKSLGLGSNLVAPDLLLEVWTERTGRSKSDLAKLLQQQALVSKDQHKSLKPPALLALLEKWRQLSSGEDTNNLNHRL